MNDAARWSFPEPLITELLNAMWEYVEATEKFGSWNSARIRRALLAAERAK